MEGVSWLFSFLPFISFFSFILFVYWLIVHLGGDALFPGVFFFCVKVAERMYRECCHKSLTSAQHSKCN